MSLKEMFIHSIKKQIKSGKITPTNSINIEVINLEKFKINYNEGETNFGEIIKLKQCIDSIIDEISNALFLIIHYHKKSNKYWGILKKSDNCYNVSIDLEEFMSSLSNGKNISSDYFLPDNYHLAKVVEKEFVNSSGNINLNFGEHFRECANWKFKNKNEAKKLVDFIDYKYVQPKINEIMKKFNIENVYFSEKEVDFKYKK